MGTFALGVTLTDSLVGVSCSIVVTGLTPGTQVSTVTQTRRSNGVSWHSRVAFVADAQGTINLIRDMPVSGGCTGVSMMGVIWSQRPEDGKAREMFPLAAIEPSAIMPTAAASGESVRVGFVQWLAAPGVTRHDVRTPENEYDLVGTLYLPDPYTHPGPRPAILILDGSGGGTNEPHAMLYASHGYATFALAYFKAPGLPDYISSMPLEHFERALVWLRKRVESLRDFVAVSDQSREGKLALLLGAIFPEAVSTVVGYVPGVVTHSGQNAADSAVGREGPTRLYCNQPLSHLWRGNRIATWAPLGEGSVPHRRECTIHTALQDADAVVRARIRIECARRSVLLLSATDDGSWLSSDYSRIVTTKLAEVHHPYPVQHFDYEGTGHAIVLPYVPTMQLIYTHLVSDRISTTGGKPCANARADVQPWTAVPRFLASAVTTRDVSVFDSWDLSSMDSSPAHSVVDQVTGLDDSSVTHALRCTRGKVATATQGSYGTLFDTDVPGLTLGEHLLVAPYACCLTLTPELAEHYRVRPVNTLVDADALQAVDHDDIDTLASARLRAIPAFTRTLVERPIESDCDALLRLPIAGLVTVNAVTLAQLIASMSCQMRLVAGLHTLREAVDNGSVTASTETTA